MSAIGKEIERMNYESIASEANRRILMAIDSEFTIKDANVLGYHVGRHCANQAEEIDNLMEDIDETSLISVMVLGLLGQVLAAKYRRIYEAVGIEDINAAVALNALTLGEILSSMTLYEAHDFIYIRYNLRPYIPQRCNDCNIQAVNWGECSNCGKVWYEKEEGTICGVDEDLIRT